jgi:hypothetical protein
MDIEKMTHTGYRLSVLIAVILSAMVVMFAAILGRGALNLKGALLVDEPTDVTVIAVVEPKLSDGVAISGIDFLRKEKRGENEKPFYAYQVKTSDEAYYLVKIGYDEDEEQWALMVYESLHADPITSASESAES